MKSYILFIFWFRPRQLGGPGFCLKKKNSRGRIEDAGGGEEGDHGVKWEGTLVWGVIMTQHQSYPSPPSAEEARTNPIALLELREHVAREKLVKIEEQKVKQSVRETLGEALGAGHG